MNITKINQAKFNLICRFEADRVERNRKFWHNHHSGCSRCHDNLTEKAIHVS